MLQPGLRALIVRGGGGFLITAGSGGIKRRRSCGDLLWSGLVRFECKYFVFSSWVGFCVGFTSFFFLSFVWVLGFSRFYFVDMISKKDCRITTIFFHGSKKRKKKRRRRGSN